MLNRIQFEGLVMNLWRYGGHQYARLLHRPDPGQNERDILMTVRFKQHTPLDVRRGDLLRVWGFLDNRPMDGNPSGRGNGNPSTLRQAQGSGRGSGESYVAEVVTDGIVLLGRDQLPHQKARGRSSPKVTADTGDSDNTGGTTVVEPEGEAEERRS